MADHCHSVLVVDDNPECLDALTFFLETAGFQVEGAGDGEIALARLQSGALPCVVLTDAEMPRFDGWALVDAMRANPRLAGIPIVMTSGYRQFVSRALAAGVRAYLQKPVDPGHLAATLARYCPALGALAKAR